ncbi:prepro-urotensin II-beta-like [Sinocyclocheilus rhinocerous]|uniref:Prepro-urotensin II-beta-like n=1 Tax=Sinocyclocheilus rhinocerous TaxID=307959 RepID=A0A673M7U8_9TELE|nr:PREDICTED: prepro-urotensin II-beta-like [Sinocyclocheilus rhinocerous]
MMCKLFLFSALLLSVLEPLLGHPLIHSAEMTYARPVLVEEEQVVSPDDLSYSKQAYLSQGAAGFGYPSLFTGDISSDGLKTAGFVPSQAAKEVLLEKPLLSRFLGGRKQYRKRGSSTECFWKYCV